MARRSGFFSGFGAMYNPHSPASRGHFVVLMDALITGIYNVFITGILYTGFLTMYDISITGVGIVSFIPYIATCFSVFSPYVLGKFKHRKTALLLSKAVFYFLYIIATTVMPQFVKSPDGRVTWLVIIIFVAHAFYALFSPGFTSWYAKYIPADMKERSRYFQWNQFIAQLFACSVLFISGWIADALSKSPYQQTLILGMRYFAFALVLLDIGVQAMVKDETSVSSARVKMKEIFTLPVKNRKFLLCMILQFAWNFNANLNNGPWNFHLLNHLHFSYTLINMMSVLYTFIFLFTARLWQKELNRRSWIYTFGISNLMWFMTEFMMFMLTPERSWIFIIAGVTQQFLNVGLNLSYANILYMNMPEEKSTTYVSFNVLGCNIFAFLGLMFGTMICSINGENPVPFMGMQVYPVQFTCLLRCVNMLGFASVCMKFWRSFTSQSEIERVEPRKSMPRTEEKQLNEMR